MNNEKDWYKIYLEKSQLYLKEFESREVEGKESAIYLSKYLTENFPNRKKILDMPCGNGRISRNLANKGFDILGIDFSDVFIKDAKNKSKDHHKHSYCEFEVGELSNDLTLEKIRFFSPEIILNWWTSFGYSTKEADKFFFKKIRDTVLQGTILLVETWHRFPIVDFPIVTRWNELGDFLVLVKNFIDPLNESVKSEHTYYVKEQMGLTYVDSFTSEIILYDILELIRMFDSCNWELKSIFNSLQNPSDFDIHRDRVVLVMEAR